MFNFNNYFNILKNKINGHYVGFKSLGLFIRILYKLRQLFERDLFDNKKFLENLKKDILNSGCISIKFTQWIISKLKGSDNFDKYKEIIEFFEEVFENCKYHPKEYSKSRIEELFDDNFENIFDIYNFEPIASGSIGQVYKTKYINEDKDIIIKIRHPNIEYIKSYQMIFVYFIIFLQKFRYFKNRYHLHFNLNDFIENINRQIDLNIESTNCLKMANIYKDNKLVIVPEIYKFNKDVIISSYEPGEYIDDIPDYQKCKVAINLLCLVNDMCLINNFMHGDMHSRNWKVRELENTYQIILYDFGICFTGPDKEYNKKLWLNGETQQIEKIIELFLDENVYIDNREEMVKNLHTSFKNICTEPFNMNVVFNKLIVIFSNNNLIINNLFLNIIVFMCLVEEIFKKTNIICQDFSKVGINSHIKSQKLDIITFCKTQNVYPELLKFKQEELKEFMKFERENMNNEDLKFKKSELFDISKVSNFVFDNPE